MLSAPLQRRLIQLALAAIGLALLVGGKLLGSAGLLGNGAETYGHAWRQWWVSETLPSWPSGPNALLWTPLELPLIDPLPTLFASSVGAVMGIEIGYNSWILASIGLAFIGGACLARRLGGDPWTGGVVLALSPPLLGSLSSGLTEDGAVGLVAMALALIGDRDWRKGALGGLLLGLSAFCGLVLAWGGAILAVIWSLSILMRDRDRWKSLLAGTGAALALAWPAASLQGARLSGEGHRLGSHIPGPEPLWPLNPWQGVDLASFLRPGRFDAGEAIIRMHPAWLGGIALGLGIWAAWKLRMRTLALWVGLLLLICWAPGDHLSWAGEPLGTENPFTSLMDLLPFGELINHHGRLLIIGSLALAGLASLGAAQLGRRAPWAAAAIVVEMLLLSPISPVLPVAPSAAPEVLSQVNELVDGPLLVLPISGPGVHFQRPFLDQRAHGRVLVADPQRPGLPAGMDSSWTKTETAAWLSSLAFCTEDNPEPHHRCEPPSDFEPPPDVALLFSPPAYRSELETLIGPPARTGNDGAVWELSQ